MARKKAESLVEEEQAVKEEKKTTKPKSTTKKTSTKKAEKPVENKKVEKEETVEKEEKQEKKSKSTKKVEKPKTETKKTTKSKSTKPKSTTKKKATKKEEVKEEVKVEVIEEKIEEEVKEEDKEEKFSKTFIEKTKQFFDESEEYVENAIDLEEDERTREFESTQIIKIREALKPINTTKTRKKKKSEENIDENFLDVNNKEEHLFLKLFIIIGIIALFIWAMPKIAYKLNKHFVIDSDFTPYIPPQKEETPVETPKEDVRTKSENVLTEEEVKTLLASIDSEKLKIPTSTDNYTLSFEKHTMDINGVECYIIDVYAEVDNNLNRIAGFAVSIYGEKIFKMNDDNGGYEDLKI